MPPAATAIAHAAATAPVLVVGGANVDLLASCHAPAVLADSNPGRVRSAAGGVGRNIAQRLAELGRPVRLVAVLGDDEAGRWLLAQGRAAGIDMGGCALLAGQATARYVSLHQSDGELLLAVNDMAITAQLGPAQLAAEAAALQAAPAVVLEANLAAPALAALWALPAHVALWADAVSVAKCTRLAAGLARLHTLKANRLEALALTGLPATATDTALADALHARGLPQLALSRGADGLLLSQRGPDGHTRRHHHPAAPVPTGGSGRNVTGAGDALLAGLLHAQLQGWGLAEAAAQATAAAARALGGLALVAAPAPAG